MLSFKSILQKNPKIRYDINQIDTELKEIFKKNQTSSQIENKQNYSFENKPE